MAPRIVTRLVLILCVLLLIILSPLHSAFAQYTDGRWALGFHGGGNLWMNDYNKKKVGPGGEIMVRYGITRAFSAGLLAGYEELKSKEEPTVPGRPDYLKLHAMPASFVGWIHFAPGKKVNPYLYAGFGAMLYKRLDGLNNYIPNSKFKTSIHVPFGVGLEVYAAKKVSIVVDAGYRVTDDYPDAIKLGKIDGYATAKAGVNFYFGTSNTEREELAAAEASRLRDSTEAEIRRVKELADAEVLRMKALAEAEAQRIRDSTEAEARRLAELNARRPVDTVIVLEKGKTVILRGVNFEFNKATLTEDSKTILERAFNALEASPDLNVLIVGHTDNVGSAAYNKKLSLRRAQSVKSWLEAKGVRAKRLTVAGKGFDEPIDDNKTDEGRANNRRIEFRVLK
jgi:outer membrane protein OmpA-like peptidoglycan-associated protein